MVTDEVVHGFSKLEFCEFSGEQVWLTKLFDCIRTMFRFAMLPMFRPLQWVPVRAERKRGGLVSMFENNQ